MFHVITTGTVQIDCLNVYFQLAHFLCVLPFMSPISTHSLCLFLLGSKSNISTDKVIYARFVPHSFSYRCMNALKPRMLITLHGLPLTRH